MGRDRYQYGLDVGYEVWRSGGNPDRVSYDRVDNHYYNGVSAESAAYAEMRHWREQREAREMQEAYEEDQMRQHYEEEQRRYWEEVAAEEQRLDAEYGPAVASQQ